jgi:hypothetical protein
MSTYIVNVSSDGGVTFARCGVCGQFKDEQSAVYAVEILEKITGEVYQVVKRNRGRPKGSRNVNGKRQMLDKIGVTIEPEVTAEPQVIDTVGEVVEDNNFDNFDNYVNLTPQQLDEMNREIYGSE